MAEEPSFRESGTPSPTLEDVVEWEIAGQARYEGKEQVLWF
jgi:hypothetical protein